MKKSIVISLLTVIILFATALYSFASTGIVTADTLRLRREPSSNSTVIELLSMNDEVEIIGEENGWYKVNAKVNSVKYTGYVSKDYIKLKEQKKPTENKTDNEENNNAVENKEEEPKENTTPEESSKPEEPTKSEESKTFVKVINKDSNVYITPVINSMILNKVEEEKQIEISSEVNGWSYITAVDIKGWVRTEDIEEKEVVAPKQEENQTKKMGYITGTSVNFREESKTSGKVITKLNRNYEVTVLEEKDGWAKIEYAGKTGYVSSDYISNTKQNITSRSSINRKEATENTKTESTTEKNTSKETKSTSNTSNGKASGSEIVAYAKKYLGSKYVYGGSSPKGFDCSGFTTYVYKHFGYSISRSSSAQSYNGKSVSKSELREGDIICFSKSSKSKKINHVGIYIGANKFIHAANERKGVIISKISGDGFYFVCARRII